MGTYGAALEVATVTLLALGWDFGGVDLGVDVGDVGDIDLGDALTMGVAMTREAIATRRMVVAVNFIAMKCGGWLFGWVAGSIRRFDLRWCVKVEERSVVEVTGRDGLYAARDGEDESEMLSR